MDFKMVSACALALLISISIPGVTSYSTGPPLSACMDMFPVGHGSDAQNAKGIQAPFSITVNSTMYHPGHVIQVNLNSTQGWIFEGVFIQARRANCSSPMKDYPVGTFQTMPNETRLSLMSCSAMASSAISHNQELDLNSMTFYWIAPSVPVGHVYLRGTFARNKTVFWTDVFSNFIADANLSDQTKQKCTVRTALNTGNGNTLVISLWPFYLSLFLSFL